VTDQIQQLVLMNERFAGSEDAPAGELPAPPTRGVAIVTCMDARLDVYAALGLRPGDAHVLRNAGGVITEDIDPLAGDLTATPGHARSDADPPHALRHGGP